MQTWLKMNYDVHVHTLFHLCALVDTMRKPSDLLLQRHTLTAAYNSGYRTAQVTVTGLASASEMFPRNRTMIGCPSVRGSSGPMGGPDS